MPSASSPVRDALEAFVAGRIKPERLVIAVAAAYYGETGRGKRETLRPLIDVIERASPGIVELGSDASSPGFGIRLAERPFPKQYESDLRRAVEAYLASERPTGVIAMSHPPVRASGPGVIARIVGAVRRLFAGSR